MRCLSEEGVRGRNEKRRRGRGRRTESVDGKCGRGRRGKGGRVGGCGEVRREGKENGGKGRLLVQKISLGRRGMSHEKTARKVACSEDVRRIKIVPLCVCAYQAHHLSIGYAHKPRSQA